MIASATDLADARALLASRGWDGVRPLVVLAPGAAYGHAKRWPPERYAALDSALVSSHGATCGLVGAGVDAEATRLVREVQPDDAPDSSDGRLSPDHARLAVRSIAWRVDAMT